VSRGHDRERRVRRLLEDDGWWTARAAGSLGDADVVALKDGERARLVEVKSSAQGPYEHFRPAARRDLLAAAAKAGAEPWLVWWPPRKTLQWIPAAEWPLPRAA